jgi:hypothetical protein
MADAISYRTDDLVKEKSCNLLPGGVLKVAFVTVPLTTLRVHHGTVQPLRGPSGEVP